MAIHIERTLNYFARGDDELAGQLSLVGVDLAFLQSLFGRPVDDPMVEAFPVSPEQAEALQPFASGEIQTDRYDYYLDCSGEPAEESPDALTEAHASSRDIRV